MSDEPPKRPVQKAFTDQNRKKSIGHEKRIAKRLGGKTVKNSGAGFRTGQDRIRESGVRTEHADIRTKDFKIEHKFTKHKSISLQKEWLDGIRISAGHSTKYPALGVTFDCPDVSKPDDWILIPLEVFERILGKLESDDD
jgi:hypothetical protein